VHGSRGDAIDARTSGHVQPVPGRTTLTQSLAPVPAPVPAVGARTGPSPLPRLDLAPRAPSSLGAWAGAGTTGRIFQHEAIDGFVDGATGDTAQVLTAWTLAEHMSFELQTDAVLAVMRTIHVRLARGATVVAKSRARAWVHADRLPNDVHAALHAPARLIKHDGSIIVIDERGVHLLGALPAPLAEARSVAELLGGVPLLGLETDGPQRIREAEQLAAVTVPRHDANLEQIAALLRDAPLVAVGLTRYIQAKLAYESPPAEPLAIGRHMIQRIEALTSGTWTGYEGTAVLFQLDAMRSGFARLVARAEQARPAEKDAWDHAADAARAIGGAVVGVGAAMKELVLTARDLGLWLTDDLARVVGRDRSWEAASSIGKAYQSGKSTGEIFLAIVGGIVDAWDQAIDHAANGDYSKLMSLGAELALDLAIGVATAGAAGPALAAKRVGSGARLAGRSLALAAEAAEALAGRTRAALAKVRRTALAAPAAARRAALALEDALQGLLEGLAEARHLVDAATGRPLAVLDPGAIPRAIQHVRGARAMESAASAMRKLRGPAARAQGERVLRRLGKLAGKPRMADAIQAVARQIAEGDGKARLVAALERVLETWPTRLKAEPEVLARVLRRIGDAVDPVKLLDDAAWAASHKGLTPAARSGLLRHAARSRDPLDLRWLRESSELPAPMLEFMALDRATSWKELMKVSTRPSDYFPSSVKKLLTPDDYARAAGKLRGIAGEMVFVVENVELPAGLKIVGRQVEARGKIIDFALQDAHGRKAKLEVKAWSRKTWERELADPARVPPESAARRMVEQLRAAKATGEPVYLAVPDSIGDTFSKLKQLLDDNELTGITVITFPESKLRSIFSKLRAGLGLAAGVALVTADQIMEAYDG
jgi:hypothetical protein